MSELIVDARGLVKRYANGVLANDAVSLQVRRGSVHAVVGENGAGKSTLMKMLYGLEQPDAGELLIDGQARRLRGPADAIALGLGLVPQHLQLVGSMTVAENVWLGAEPARWGCIDTAETVRRTQALAVQHGLQVEAEARVDTLSAGAQQRVEILKALRGGARLLLMDEPTALLTPQEAQALFESVERLVAAGMTVLLITHKMAEVMRLAEAYTVMRAGQVVGQGRVADIDPQHLAALIVGRRLEAEPVARSQARGAGPALVQVRGLGLERAGGRAALADVHFDVAAGEVLGIAGVEGNGQNHLADLLAGLTVPSRGTATLDGRAFTGQGARAARACGAGVLVEDRLQGGVALALSIAENCAALDYAAVPMSRRGVLNRAALRQRAQALIARFGVRARDAEVAMGSLSGGNMQKLVLGRELAQQPRFLVACQPTRGVDLGAAQLLHRELIALRDSGAALLLISADLEEVMTLSDRIAVLFEGRIVAHFAAGQASIATVGRYMTGLASDVGAQATLDAPLTPPEALA